MFSDLIFKPALNTQYLILSNDENKTCSLVTSGSRVGLWNLIFSSLRIYVRETKGDMFTDEVMNFNITHIMFSYIC